MALPEPSKDGPGMDRRSDKVEATQSPSDRDGSNAVPLEEGRGSTSRARPFVLGANDGPVDDFLELIDGWEETTGSSLFADSESCGTRKSPSDAETHQTMLDRVAADFSPQQIRQLAASMLKLADAVDQMWDPTAVRSSYHWITRAGQIERRSLQLAQTAIRARNIAKRRARHIPPEFLGEPAWEMLLELFVQFAGQADISTKSLCLVSGLPDTTALRLIDKLEQAGLVERSQSAADKRVTLLRLTRQGVVAVGSALSAYES